MSLATESVGTARDQIVVARLKDGLGAEQAESELSALLRNSQDFGVPDGTDFSVAGLRDSIVGPTETALVLVAAGVVVLLIAGSVNVVLLLVVRERARLRETTIRRALGATGFTLFVERWLHVLCLVGAGASVGVPLAWAESKVVRSLGPRSIPGLQHIDLTFGAIVAVFVTVAFIGTAISALLSRRVAREANLKVDLAGGGPLAARPGEDRWKGPCLIGAQAALAVLLATGSGLLGHSLMRLLSIDVGFNPQGLQYYMFARDRSGPVANEVGPLVQLLEILRARPDAGIVALGTWAPFAGIGEATSFDVETANGWKRAASIPLQDISEDYFRVMGIPLKRGRTLSDSLRAGQQCEVVVNQTFADAYWPSQSGLERRLDLRMQQGQLPRLVDLQPGELVADRLAMLQRRDHCVVVGVAGDVRERALTDPPAPRVYFSLFQRASGVAALLVRPAKMDRVSADVAAAIKRIVPGNAAKPVQAGLVVDGLRRSVEETRFYAWLFTTVAVLALGMLGVGVFAVTWQVVVQRTREVGIRLALGASGSHVVFLVARASVVPLTVGLVVGVGLAAGTSRYLKSVLYEVVPLDPTTFALIPILVLCAAVAAVLVPAWRAKRVDPVVLFKTE